MSDDQLGSVSEGETLIGGQFRMQSAPESCLGYRNVHCVDINSDHQVDLRLIPLSLLEKSGTVLKLQRGVKKAGALVHKNVVRVLGYGKDPTDVFVVEEHIKGLRLSHLLSRRRDSQRPFELKEAFYLTIHLCNGLAFARDTMPHGFLVPSHIIMRRDGRAKVGGFGLDAFVESMPDTAELSDWDRACLDAEFDEASQRDLYALGRIFYALLKNSVDVSRPFIEQVEDDEALSPGLIRLLLRCAGSPDVKPLTGPSDFREELHFIVTEMFDRMVSIVPSDQISDGPPPMPHEVFLESIAKPAGLDLEGSSTSMSTEDLMADIRWMFRKGNREFGPVSGAQLVEKLNRGELSGYVDIRDIQKKRFRPLSETPAFRQVFDEWASQADVREERLADERSKASSKKWWAFARKGILVVVSLAVIALGTDALRRGLEPSPRALDLEALIAFTAPKIEVPELIEHDPEFQKKLAQYKALMARQPKKRFRTKSGEAVFQSVVDFSNPNASQAQLEEQMTMRLYGTLSRHRGLLSCLQSALPEGIKSRSFNVRVTVLPDGSLTQIGVPGGGASVGACARKVLRSYRVRSIKGVTVSATLPFTVQR